jgi:SAM-dependent methyltransferase
MPTSLPGDVAPRRKCTICDGTVFRDFSPTLLECVRCRVLVSLQQPDDIEKHYSQTFYTQDEGSRFSFGLEHVLKLFRWTRFRSLQRWAPYQRVLDVGTDRGWFLKHFQNNGAEVFGTQMSAPAARAVGGYIGRDIFLGELTDAHFADETMDLVCMYNVIEHVREPRAYLREIHRILKLGGILVLEVPNARCLTARVFGMNWLGWDIPNHIHHFDPPGLRAFAEAHRFSVLTESHWSLEFGPFHILQTLLNAIGLPHNQLYLLMQRQELRSGPPITPTQKAVQLLLAALLLVPCTFASLLLSFCRQGEVFRLICRKQSSQPTA